MEELDKFASRLLEESKRFLEIAKQKTSEEEKEAFLHAALLVSFSSLEAFINGVVDDFKQMEVFDLQTKAFLTEREIRFDKGSFILTNSLKMSRLIEKIETLIVVFNKEEPDKNSQWWTDLQIGINLRNNIVHPKEYIPLKVDDLEKIIYAIITCIDCVFRAVFKKGLPVKNLGLDSKFNF